MDLRDLLTELDGIIADLPSIVLESTEVAANDALALVDQRLTQKGTDANGAPFQDYTPNYKKLKTAKGRYRGHVDFMDSGQMLASTSTGFENITPAEKSVRGNNATIVFAGRDELTQKKLDGNNNNRPGFMLPSKAEVDNVTELQQTRIERILQQRLT